MNGEEFGLPAGHFVAEDGRVFSQNGNLLGQVPPLAELRRQRANGQAQVQVQLGSGVIQGQPQQQQPAANVLIDGQQFGLPFGHLVAANGQVFDANGTQVGQLNEQQRTVVSAAFANVQRRRSVPGHAAPQLTSQDGQVTSPSKTLHSRSSSMSTPASRASQMAAKASGRSVASGEATQNTDIQQEADSLNQPQQEGKLQYFHHYLHIRLTLDVCRDANPRARSCDCAINHDIATGSERQPTDRDGGGVGLSPPHGQIG